METECLFIQVDEGTYVIPAQDRVFNQEDLKRNVVLTTEKSSKALGC